MLRAHEERVPVCGIIWKTSCSTFWSDAVLCVCICGQATENSLLNQFLTFLTFNLPDQFVFLMSRDCCVALPHDAVGLSAVCDCGIF